MVNALLANAVEMTISSVASSGVGDVTMGSAVGDNNTFAQAGYLDGPGVSYTIEETNGDYENGVGHLTTTQTILVRDQAMEKSVGGTVTRLPATKLTATTGGKVSVRPNALMNLGGFPTWRDAANNPLDIPDNIMRIEGTATPVADRMYYFPVIFLWPRIIAQFGVDVATADAGATNTRCGIYSADFDGGPGDLILDTGDIDLTSTGVQLITAANWATGGTSAILLPAGFYWYAFVTNSTTPRFHTFEELTQSFSIGGVDPFNNGRRLGGQFQHDNGITGALPSTPTRDGNEERPAACPVFKPV